MSDLIVALRTFLRVAEGASFSQVGDRSGASHTTIARRIDQLEAHYGAKLLHRTTRRLTLTRDGERLLDHARAVIEAVDQAEADLAGEAAARGLVRVGVTTALGLYYADRLVDLHARHPALRVEFWVSDWQDGFTEAGVDLAIRVGDPVPEAAGAVPLGLFRRRLVAAPAYLARRGVPQTAADLAGHECIAYGYGPAPAVWEVDGARLRVAGCFRANSSEAVRRAVAQGLGIGLLPEIQVRDAVAAGRLVPVLPEAEIAPLHLSVVHRPAGVRMPARVRAVLDFLVEAFPGSGS